MDGCGHATAGFTKANELFVGRVAMIGFAASLVRLVVGLVLKLVHAWDISAMTLHHAACTSCETFWCTALPQVGEYFQNGKGPLGQLGTLSKHLCEHAHAVYARDVLQMQPCCFRVMWLLLSSGIPMPAYADAAGFALAGWILFFFAAAIGSGNFPGEVNNFWFHLNVVLNVCWTGGQHVAIRISP